MRVTTLSAPDLYKFVGLELTLALFFILQNNLGGLELENIDKILGKRVWCFMD
jgi:hypothetical protein